MSASSCRRIGSPWRVALLAAFLALGAGATRARADDATVPAELQAKIFLRALAYDRGLPEGGGPLVIAVVYLAGDRASEALRGDIARALGSQAASRTLKKREVHVAEVAWTAAGGRSALQANAAAVVYLCAADGLLAKSVRPVARDLHLRSVGASPALIDDVAVAVTQESGFPKLLINLAVSREEGMALDSELLKIARVVHD